MKEKHTRRKFIQAAGVGAAASLAAGATAFGQTSRTTTTRRPTTTRTATFPPPQKRLYELGMASYTLRSFNLDEAIAMTKRVGLKNIALKSMHMPMDSSAEQIKAIAGKVREAGLNLYGCGVVYMKDAQQVNQAFDYAKAAGMKVIIGVPSHNLLALVDKKVKEYDIKVAIHNHGPGDKVYPTPESIYEKVKDLDKRIGICMDIGHSLRAGANPSRDAMRYSARLHDVHIKDVTAAKPEGKAVEVGRGVIDIPMFMRTLLRIKYAGFVSFEYEKDAKDPLAGLAESVGYVKGVMAATESRGYTRPRTTSTRPTRSTRTTPTRPTRSTRTPR
jgi:sugar phosphate isomerase/epimerase